MMALYAAKVMATPLIAGTAAFSWFGYIGAAAAIGGVVAVGTLRTLAWAWREEKNAAVEKAERLAEAVAAADLDRATLRGRVEVLEKQTNFANYTVQATREHKAIVDALEAVRDESKEHTRILAHLKLGIPADDLGGTL